MTFYRFWGARMGMGLIVFAGGWLTAGAEGIPFDKATVTQVVGQVEILDAETLTPREAALDEVFKAPDILQTGRRSRCQLKAADDTVTRIGSNTVFSFDPSSRTIDLKQGTVLFNSKSGNGGGTIRTASATASVLGTTIAVAATPSGGFKMIVYEGVAKVTYPSGAEQTLKAGQMTFIMPGSRNARRGNSGTGEEEGTGEESGEGDPGAAEPDAGGGEPDAGGGEPDRGTGDAGTGEMGGTLDSGGDLPDSGGADVPAGEPGPVLDFDLGKAVEGSELVGGFAEPLASIEKVEVSVDTQKQEISSGELEETGVVIVDATESSSGETELTVFVNEALNTNLSEEVLALRAAASADVTVPSSGALPAANTFTKPFFVPYDVIQEKFPWEGADPNDPYEQMFLGFVGQNVTVSAGTVNLSAFDAAVDENGVDRIWDGTHYNYLMVLFIASGKMEFNAGGGLTTFTGLGQKRGFDLGGQTGITLPAGYDITAEFTTNISEPAEFMIWSGAGLNFNTNMFYGNEAALVIEAEGGDFIDNYSTFSSSIMASDPGFDGGRVHLSASGNMNFHTSNFVTRNLHFGGDPFDNTDKIVPGTIIIDSSTFSGTHRVTGNALGTIKLQSPTIPSGMEIDFSAGNNVTINNATFSAASARQVNLSADTVVLNFAMFNGNEYIVNIKSRTGVINFEGAAYNGGNDGNVHFFDVMYNAILVDEMTDLDGHGGSAKIYVSPL